MESIYKGVNKILFKWKNDNNESLVLEDGTECILSLNKIIAGHTIPNQFFHELYSPISEEDLQRYVIKEVPLKLPDSYINLLRIYNGFKIFDETINVYGFRNGNIKYRLDKAPFDLFRANQIRKKGTPQSWFIFGSYGFDGSNLVYDTKRNDDRVYRIENSSIKILNEWESFNHWLTSEVSRISELFDSKGNLLKDELEPKPN